MRMLHRSFAGLVFLAMLSGAVTVEAQTNCARKIAAVVDALDQPLMFNRLGTAYPQGMIFALDSDVVPISGTTKSAGNVNLRPGKRPRPIVLRMNEGDCLEITFNNYLNATASTFQPVTRDASIHIAGLNVVGSIASDGSDVGRNASSLIPPGGTTKYTVYGAKPGTFLLYSMGSLFGAASELGQLMAGLFGALHVEPRGAEYYRSQVSRADFELVQTPLTPVGPPLIKYDRIYPANYPDATRRCLPVLKMLDIPRRVVNGQCEMMAGAPLQLFHSDLTGVITGPGGGMFVGDGPEFQTIPASPNRRKPFREFTILYHEAANAVQAFKQFYQPPQPNDGGFSPPDLSEVLTNGADNLAINYGTGGIAAEILASRMNVGPMANCVDCKFEEFFLSAWAVGDPAMVVDVPANVPASGQSPTNALLQCQDQSGDACTNWNSIPDPKPGPKANIAYFPDDPSNVYHSYLNDHVKFHILNAGSTASHIHHQHAHQWLHTPNDPNSSYLDSQLLGPSAAYTLEIDYGGSGNRNRTVGDSIFHCHFYPHFAGGMWAMWRVHDVFESGTPLNPDGSVPPNVRALPDGEIATGTAIPALIPLPTYGMAPLPAQVVVVPVCKPQFPNCGTNRAQWAGTEAKVIDVPNFPNKNPGYPFFIPGVSGHRPPHPPYDFACEQLANGQCKTDGTGQIVYLDGGLGRHVVLDGTIETEKTNQWDFTRDTGKLAVRRLPETGSDVERRAINFFSTYQYASYTPDGRPAPYNTNGLPRGPQRGSPFADPATENGQPVGNGPRVYKAAVLQTDVVFNKAGWHYPQQRLITLWGDVQDTLNGVRPPEPFFFRANSNDVIEFWHTNLVPSYYELDDFQVRTPTDVIGQHIHLVKFDVTSSDGAANGFNYEDGTFSPDEVRERIDGIRSYNQCGSSPPPGVYCPTAKAPPPQVGSAPYGQNWLGAQTTIQRWWADPLQGCLNAQYGCGGTLDGDRTLRTVFTHDHFGPSTHQQIGLYAGLLVEPPGSKWLDPKSGDPMGGRYDGGPTSWQANIITPNIRDSFREFALEFGDNSLAYDAGSRSSPGTYPPVPYPTVLTNTSTPWGWADCSHAIGGPIRTCPPSGTGSAALQAQPGVITAQQGVGTMTVNYRNEPLGLRAYVPSTGAAPNPDPNASDMSHLYRSIARSYPPMNSQPKGPFPTSAPPWPVFRYPGGFTGAQPYDPYTPLLRAYQGDRVQIRVLVGSNLFQHDFIAQGLRWFFEPSMPNSGFRSHQTMGISEHYEFVFDVPTTATNTNPQVKGSFADYLYVPGAGTLDLLQGLWGIFRAYNGAGGTNLQADLKPLPNNSGGGVTTNTQICPWNAPVKNFDITAISGDSIPGSSGAPNNITYNNRIATQPISVLLSPLIWVRTDQLRNGKLVGKPEPLILRANAGDCINITLRNAFNVSNPVFAVSNGNPITYSPSLTTQALTPSTSVGLNPQLVSYDVTKSNGGNIGLNPVQTVTAGGTAKTYQWFAGTNKVNPDASRSYAAVEFGSTNLMTSDPLYQQPQAMIGALIIEPAGSVVAEDPGTKAQAWVTPPGGTKFRELVAIHQNNVNLQWDNGSQSSTSSINYGSEPMWYRYATSSNGPNTNYDTIDVSQAFSNCLEDNSLFMNDPQTPVFTAPTGSPVRFRVLHPDGPGGFPDTIWMINGHQWQEEPFTNSSRSLGDNPNSNVQGARDGVGPGGAFDVLTKAGGNFSVPGDYLYLSFPAFEFPYGNWGVFRVGNNTPTPCGAPTGISQPNAPAEPPALNRFNKKRRSSDGVEPAERRPDNAQGADGAPNP